MSLRHALPAVLAFGSVLALAGCGGATTPAASFDSAHDLYEQLREEIGCETVDPENIASAKEGEVADGSPTFEMVAGHCTSGDDEVMVAAVVVEGGEGVDAVEAMSTEDVEGYAVHAANWAVATDKPDDEDRAFVEAAQDLLGGDIVTFSEDGVEKA